MAWSGQTVAAVAGRRLERGVRLHRGAVGELVAMVTAPDCDE
jgi:hypothetical protein